MKRLLILVAALLITTASIAQNTVTAYKTEIYKHDGSKWAYDNTNRDVTIPIHVMKRFIHVEAKNNAYFLLEDKPETITGSDFKGFRYVAYDFVMQTKCHIDIVDMTNMRESMISVIWEELGYNVRYYYK
jgi:hypothetical protein